MSAPAFGGRWAGVHGRSAGLASRGAAYLLDLIISVVVFELALTAVSFAAQVITGRGMPWHRDSIAVVIAFALWHVAYLGFHWANHHKTPGMSVLGLNVVRGDGANLKPWRGWVRSLAFPLSFLTLGLGFVSILAQREHRALHDLIAGTAVVYAGDTRAARLRYLAQGDTPAAPVPGPRRGHAGHHGERRQRQ